MITTEKISKKETDNVCYETESSIILSLMEVQL